MSAYNAERYINEAVESVLYQTYKDFELTLIDDGSTDSTREKIMRYTDIPNVRILVFDKNVGLSNALNTGIDVSMGKYYVFFAADDRMGPTALEMLHGLIEGQPDDVVMIYTSSFVIDEKGDIVRDEIVGTQPYDPHGLCTVNAASCIVRMDALRKIKEIYGYVYDPKIKSANDWDLWIRLSKIGKIIFGVGEPLTYYRKYLGSLSTSKLHEDERNKVALKLARNDYGLPNPSRVNWKDMMVVME